MPEVLGGIRDRFIIESVTNAISDALSALGWFDTDRWHAPIRLVDEYPDENIDVPLNTLAVSIDFALDDFLELGNDGREVVTSFYLDFFAENDAVSRHLIGDIYEFLRTSQMLDVYDYRETPPVHLFKVEVEGIERERPSRVVTPWQQHWMTLSFDVRDIRGAGGQ